MSPRRFPDRRPPAGDSKRRRRHTPRRTPEDNVRVAAAWVLERTLESSAPVTSYLAGVEERFEERDQALLRELVLGSLRWLRRLDHVIATASHRSFGAIEPALHAPLRIAAYQLLFLDRVPAYAAVDEAVEQARYLTHRGAASFVNAVLRRVARSTGLDDWPVEVADDVCRWGIELSHPDFLVRRWSERLGWSRAIAVMRANNRPKPLHLLAFRDRGGRELLAEALIDDGVEVEPSFLSPLGLVVRQGNPLSSGAFRRGEAYVQDEASQVAALLPPPGSGERVLDGAAAPGGKSFALVASEPTVKLTLSDLSLQRLLVLRDNQRRLARPAAMLVGDVGKPPFVGDFDRVVLDLPCSGTGTLRKHPELKWRLSAGEIGRLSRAAQRMLGGGAAQVAPGGLLVAITCSIEVEENESVVERFLRGHPGFELFDLAATLASPLDGFVEAPGRWRILPGGDHDGFTVHVLRRRS